MEIVLSKGLNWLYNSIDSYTPFSSLNPWFLLKKEECFNVSKKIDIKSLLVVFAKRQDCDDAMCIEIEKNTIVKYHLIECYTSKGYDIIETYTTFWDCFKSMLSDIEELVEQ